MNNIYKIVASCNQTWHLESYMHGGVNWIPSLDPMGDLPTIKQWRHRKVDAQYPLYVLLCSNICNTGFFKKKEPTNMNSSEDS